MSTSATTLIYTYTGNGSTTTFTITNPFLDNDHIDVYVDGVEQTSGFTVSGGGSASGGSVVFTTAPTNAAEIVIVNNPPLTQLLDLTYNGKLPSTSLEDAIDKLTYIVQKQQQEIDRSLRFPIWESAADVIENADRASKVLGFDASGDPTFTAIGDAIARSGTVVEYATVAAMTADTGITSYTTGQSILLKGYYAAGDFGLPIQLVIAAATGGIKSFTLNDGRYANLYSPGWANVKWFGAKGDGATDDNAAIQAAITALTSDGASGGTVFFPKSSGFLISSTLEVDYGNVRLLGLRKSQASYSGTGKAEGYYDIIYKGVGTAIHVNSAGANTVASFEMENIWMSGFDGTTATGAIGLTLGSQTGSYLSVQGALRNCNFSGFATYGVSVNAIANFLVDSCVFQGNATGWYVDDWKSTTSATGDYNIFNCRFRGHTGPALLDNSMNLTKILYSVFESNEAEAIKCVTPYLGGRLEVTGCDFEDNCNDTTGDYWIYLTPASGNILFSGNSIGLPTSTANYGFLINPATSFIHGVFINNRYTGTTGDMKGVLGSDGSHTTYLTVIGESEADWTVSTGSRLTTHTAQSPEDYSTVPGMTYLAGASVNERSGSTGNFYFKGIDALMLDGGQQLRKAGSRSGAASYPAKLGSTAFNSATAVGKHHLFVCTTGSTTGTPPASGQAYTGLNVSVCGWNSQSSSTPSATDIGQIKVTGTISPITNFTGGQDGQTIHVLNATGGSLTFTASANIVTKAGTDLSINNGLIAVFMLNGSAWTEI